MNIVVHNSYYVAFIYLLGVSYNIADHSTHDMLKNAKEIFKTLLFIVLPIESNVYFYILYSTMHLSYYL